MTLTNQRISSRSLVPATLRPAAAANMILSWIRYLWSTPRRLNDYVDRLEIGIIDFDPPSQQDSWDQRRPPETITRALRSCERCCHNVKRDLTPLSLKASSSPASRQLDHSSPVRTGRVHSPSRSRRQC